MAEHLTVDQRRATGRAARKAATRASQAAWTPLKGRPDPYALLHAQDKNRQQDLVPVRWGRMSVSPFTFYRGAAALMAADLEHTPVSGLRVQLCGDAHLLNFGLYGSPERTLLFDLNDFDETLPGPFEWDVKRLAASIVVAGRDNALTAAASRDAALAAVRSYRVHMAEYAAMREIDIWYSRVSSDDAVALAAKTKGVKLKPGNPMVVKARTRDSKQALTKLAEPDGKGSYRLREDPPLLIRVGGDIDAEVARRALADYRRTLEVDRRMLIDRYRIVDFGRKVVGVGSVGTLCLIVLMLGRDAEDPLFLQLKEANASVLEPYCGRSAFRNHAARVVAGQRIMQAQSDVFLGWIRGSGAEHRDFYWRQLRDMKGSVPVELLNAPGLLAYAELCGWCLARAHARSGQSVAISAYLGASDTFDRAVASFAEAYADQTEADYATLAKAIKAGKIKVERDI